VHTLSAASYELCLPVESLKEAIVTRPRSDDLFGANSNSSSPSTLLVVGAGPKALAVAAKQAVLRQLGYRVPKLVVIDRHGVAAHWSGTIGYTDGQRLLGTLPEKDLGFPYLSLAWGDVSHNQQVSQAMLAYSWQTYLIAHARFSDWIDRGRLRPTHQEWSEYLQWVASQLDLTIYQGEVVGIQRTVDGRRWQVAGRTSEHEQDQILLGDGLVLTGPGTPLLIDGQPTNHPRIFDGATIWQHLRIFESTKNDHSRPLHLGVIGTGETAAAVVVALLERLQDQGVIDVISPRGILYTRDEGFEENHLFSDPEAHWITLSGSSEETLPWSRHATLHHHPVRWSELSEEDRREFVQRTDRGVFSTQAMSDITGAWNVMSLAGTARCLEARESEVVVETVYAGLTHVHQYDYVIVARGFDPLWFTTLFDQPTLEYFHAVTDDANRRNLERSIGADLSVSGLTPRLHLPMLAGVAQGPGFPNLSCLGLLADCILAPYVVASGSERGG
jgi:mycobactin lysine-N-oxygenase